jgi:hypothetical protein
VLTTEVAELTGKQHRNVLADTRKMLAELHGQAGLLRFQQSYRAGNSKHETCYLLPKRELMVLVTGYSVAMRAALVDRVEQLEAKRRPGKGAATHVCPAQAGVAVARSFALSPVPAAGAALVRTLARQEHPREEANLHGRGDGRVRGSRARPGRSACPGL